MGLPLLPLCFEAILGLKVNPAKSQLIPVGEDPQADYLVSRSGCRVSSIPTTYLGLPLRSSFKAKAM